ncbi:MAG: hypothetical protein MK008_03000 [Bdellovibrionales bacterium]|nr:hypothetical protein [Bdellovibrionales bacterium]
MKFVLLSLIFASFTAHSAEILFDGSTVGMRYRSQANAQGQTTHNQLQYRFKVFTTLKANENWGLKAGLLSSESYSSSWMNTGVDVDRNTEFDDSFYLKRLHIFYQSNTDIFDYKVRLGSVSNRASSTLDGVYSINGDTYNNLSFSLDLNTDQFFASLLIGETDPLSNPDTFDRFKQHKLNFTRMSFKYVTTNDHTLGYDFSERLNFSTQRFSYKHILPLNSALTLEYLQTMINDAPREGGYAVGIENKNSYGYFLLNYYDSKSPAQYNLQQTIYDELGQNLVFTYKYKFKPRIQLFVNLRHSLKDVNGQDSSAHRSQIGLNVSF